MYDFFQNSCFLLLISAVIFACLSNISRSQVDSGIWSEFDVTIECQKIPAAVFVPSTKYAIRVGNTVDSASGCDATVEVLNIILGDQAPNPECYLDFQYVYVAHTTPLLKVGGLQCWDIPTMGFSVGNGGLDNLDLDVAIQPLGSHVWNGTYQVDHTPSINPIEVVGPRGLILGNNVHDCEDYDQTCNGEIVFGGSTSTGGSTTVIKYRHPKGVSHDQQTQPLSFVFSD